MTKFVICINNESNPAGLIVGKVYQALPDKEAKAIKMFRIIDEDRSEQDGYLYPMSMLAPINVPEATKKALLKNSLQNALASTV